MKYDRESINKRKKNSKLIKIVADILLVILIYNIILVLISCLNKIEPITIFGCKAYKITTQSMEPTINAGDVIITKKEKEDNLKRGDIITFYAKEEVVTHRIVNIEEEGLEKKYVTKGDNNNIEDEQSTLYSDIEGKYVLTVPMLGKILDLLENKILFLFIVLVMLLLYFYSITIQERKENRREKKKIEDEKMQRKRNK